MIDFLHLFHALPKLRDLAAHILFSHCILVTKHGSSPLRCAIRTFTHFQLALQFSLHKRSILALGDITEVIPDEEADVAVLEEPEHLTWYHHGKRWKIKFRLVIGIVHTNYLEYVRREKNGQLQAFLLKYVNSWVVNIYCHRVCLLQQLFSVTDLL